MPPVIAWIATAIVSYTGVSMAVATWVSTLIVNGAVTFGAQKLLGKKANNGEFMSEVSQRTQMVRNSVAPRRLIYGRAKVSGVLVFAKETGPNREYLHMAIVLASHQCDAILDIFVNDELVPFDGSEPVADSRFHGFLRVNKHLGDAAQTADSDLVAECAPDWTTDHRLRGHAYLAVRVKFDETVFTTGLPTIAAVVRGMLIQDIRDGITRWTSNAALCLAHYMQSSYGLGVPSTEFDSTYLTASANLCDEDVGLATAFTRQCEVDSGVRHIPLTTQTLVELDGIQPGMKVVGTGIPSGSVVVSINTRDDQFFFTIDQDPTSTGSNRTLTFGDTEKRYCLNGTLDTSVKAGDAIEAMASAMAGKAVFAGGKWFIYAGGYQTPTVSLSEDDCRGPVQVITKLARRELANYTKGTYVSEADGWVVTDAPEYSPALYLSEDNDERLPRDLQLPFTTSVSAAQRLFKIELERIRQQIVTRWPCKLSALKVQCGDNVMLNNTREGWVNKVFEVTSFILVPYTDDRGQPAIGVDLVLRETAAGVWDWADGAETTYDLAANTNLPNPFIVDPPGIPVLLSDATTSWIDNDGAHVPRLQVSWAAPNDIYVLSGGRIRIQFREHGTADWIDWTLPPGDQTEEFISDVKAGKYYDVRIRSEGKRGAVSAWKEPASNDVAGYFVNGDLVPCDPVSSLAAYPLPEAIKINWVLPDITVDPNKDLSLIEVYELGTATPAPNAGTVATFRVGKLTTFTRDGVAAGVTGYYWVRTVDNSRNKSAWVGPVSATAAAGVSAALAAATGAQTTADGKNTVFRQTSAPTAYAVNDIWIDTDDSNKVYSWNGSSWEERFTPFLRLDGSDNVSGLVKVGGVSKDFVLVADKFQIWDGSSAQVPFEIVGGIVYIKESFIQYLTADKIAAGNISVALALTSGSITAAAGTDNQTVLDSSGVTVGQSSSTRVQLAQYSSGAAGLMLRNAAGTLKGFFVHQGGVTTLSGSLSSGDAIQGFDTITGQVLKAGSTADPRTIDAPLYSAGGAYVEKTLDVLGSSYLQDVYMASGHGLRFSGRSGNCFELDWDGSNVNVYVDNTFQGHIPNP